MISVVETPVIVVLVATAAVTRASSKDSLERSDMVVAMSVAVVVDASIQ